MRVIPETFNRQDWPRLVAQTVNTLARESRKGDTGGLRFDGGTSSGDEFFMMDGGGA
jgi:hypothetical protein